MSKRLKNAYLLEATMNVMAIVGLYQAFKTQQFLLGGIAVFTLLLLVEFLVIIPTKKASGKRILGHSKIYLVALPLMIFLIFLPYLLKAEIIESYTFLQFATEKPYWCLFLTGAGENFYCYAKKERVKDR